ncbi:MAG TPA: aminotransferase class I/II-fold pyridoxal phosphate-dependent enzyme [Thermoanaerobaculia bacterium]|nr:aminotransferase class I/II-fold pyridoxal phosphate-dependent enzyme [Thermoanaerobaculia bacterium]
MTTTTTVDARLYFPRPEDLASEEVRGLSSIARGLVGSEILKIAAEIRDLKGSGRTVCNLTVGDFSPSEFRIPPELERGINDALASGATNYPPADGLPELRNEVVRLYERELGLAYPIESVLIAGGARPIIFAAYMTLVQPGEKVLYPTPSWNNNHYTFLTGGVPVEIPTSAETNFLPTAEMIAPLIDGVRLICINTPLNPTGTVLARGEIEKIAQLVVDENRRRAERGDRSLFILWDHIYWMLTFGDVRHYTPPEVVPEAAAWTVIVDGISKAFAATGLRVGWCAAPPWIAFRMRDILGHVGAWAPKPEQVATARLLADSEAVDRARRRMTKEAKRRLDLLHDGFQAMKREGLPVDSIPPQGAIYLSARFDLFGRLAGETPIESNDQIRELLLDEAGFAVVPFQAFGLQREDGWMRLSVGAASPEEIVAGLGRVRQVLNRLR